MLAITVKVYIRPTARKRKWTSTLGVYMMANKKNGTIYTGVTSNLPKRVYQHREELSKGFTKTYSCKLLVWFEPHSSMENAIIREKQIKAGSRGKKLALIEANNLQWNDLFSSLI